METPELKLSKLQTPIQTADFFDTESHQVQVRPFTTNRPDQKRRDRRRKNFKRAESRVVQTRKAVQGRDIVRKIGQ
jgi:hypothetical protein